MEDEVKANLHGSLLMMIPREILKACKKETYVSAKIIIHDKKEMKIKNILDFPSHSR